MSEEIINIGSAKFIKFENKNHGYYQFGLQRTGTTFIEWMIARNFRIKRLNDLIQPTGKIKPPSPDKLTWKHSIEVPVKYKSGWPVILNYKNPYTWLESMMYRKGYSLGAWSSTYGKQLPILGRKSDTFNYYGSEDWFSEADSLVQTYRQWFNTWLDFYDKNKDVAYIIKHEDLLDENKRENVFNDFADKFGWQRPKNYVWLDHVGASWPISNRVNYYLEERPAELERKYIDLINEFFDKELMDRLQYKIL